MQKTVDESESWKPPLPQIKAIETEACPKSVRHVTVDKDIQKKDMAEQHAKHDACQLAKQLITPYRGSVSASSHLHLIPLYLENKDIAIKAYHAMHEMMANGSAPEKVISRKLLKRLHPFAAETLFYECLKSCFKGVIHSPAGTQEANVRDYCDVLFSQVFQHVPYFIAGQENLPDTPGHIFIINHISNDPRYVLPENLELAFDTHFVSAMILAPKYGNSAVRVVRRSLRHEIAHNSYYERLGHIRVYTPESDLPENFDSAQERKNFFHTARQYLQDQTNIVICPEGTSGRDSRRPGPFRPGAFLLAAQCDPHTLVVPISLAGFGHRMLNNRLAAVIGKPYRVKDVVEPNNRQAFEQFLTQKHNEFSRQVEQAHKMIYNNLH